MNSLSKKIKRNKFLTLIPLISFLSLTILPFTDNLTKLEAAEFGISVDFLIQLGISFLDRGRLAEAMHEFKKALIIDPNSTTAKELLGQIEKKIFGEEKVKGVTKILAVESALDKAEIKKKFLKGLTPPQQKELLLKEKPVGEAAPLEIAEKPPLTVEAKPIIPEKTIILDDEIKATQPDALLEIARGSSIIIQGDNIKRFLNTTPEKIEITRQDQNNIIVIAKEIGKGIFHIWDNSGRWTFNYKGLHPHLTAAFKEDYERRKLEAKLSEPFKLTYSFDHSTFHTGRRLDDTERKSLSFNQYLSLRGETPYGRYDSSVSIYRLNKKYEWDNLTMGLTDAHFWGLEHINLRIFNFSGGFAAYKFPSANLRGAMVSAPMFDGKLNYTAFWGGLPEGNYTRLEPGLGRTKDAYLEGVGLSYLFSKNASYKFYYAHTYGSKLSQPVLTDKAFGLGTFYNIGRLNFNSEIAYDDADHISYTTSASMSLPKTSISLGFTEDDRDFASPFGGSPAGGSTSARFGINFYPTKDFSISNSFNVARDRNLYNPDNPKRPNYTFSSDANWQLDQFTSINFGYSRDDTKGSLSPGITETKRLGLRKQVFFIKKLNTYLNYSNSRNKYFSASTSNYDRNTLSGGLSFTLLQNLYWSVSKGINFIENRVTRDTAQPHTLETSLSYYSRIFDTPLYGRFRISYRDEEETESAISFLSGEDRLEFSADFDYRLTSYINGYVGFRVANIWAEKEGSAKHLDAEIRYGLRMDWDTGLRWNTKGHVEGFVFEDLNVDGIKDKQEQGIANVKIISQKDKSDTTNDLGYYKIKNIVGKKAKVSIDMSSVPRGYIFTTSTFSDVDIMHNATKRVDFGLTTQSQIVGVVFVDSNGNNNYDREEQGLDSVVIILDQDKKVISDQSGQYLFSNLKEGQHTLELDLKTIPTKYIPKVSLKTSIVLEKGTTFFYNIPLRIAQTDLGNK